ncbi:bifunctional metallophosphatase/5'-nucleotidase [Vibrio genomosp. F10]|uniref:bifunctional metallophosphatase/5'-nucleotidase n=1 Tax=Vibrio genomosp. F10 TaxID=723171 RepID=UPI0002FFFA1D|nr:bifunctional UDP-sugar hydrolase/5'-nucleotidase [Vibrio genomosp. F10]OEF10610.1 bifunctional metallophosphatase/5'-nucleotidase [Vibrio genomosp. F10 str. 9ZB36]
MMNKNMKNRPAKMILAHINDTHSYFEPTSLHLNLDVQGQALTPFVSAGGFARIATRAKQLKQHATETKTPFVFLHAGDCFQGTLYFSLFKGKANADLLNALDIDAMALGNHELDMGNEPVAQFAQRINFPLLCGNWDLSNEKKEKVYRVSDSKNVLSFCHQEKIAPWMIKDAGGESIAIFGLSLDKMADIANPDFDTPFVDATETAKRTVAAIHKQGINKIILLSHLGYEADIELAKQVSGIGVIVGGHSHRLQGDFSALGLEKDDDYGIKVNTTYVVQAGFHALSIGHCEIQFNEVGEVVSLIGKNELLLGRRLFLDANMNQTGSDDHHIKACDFLKQHPNVVVCKKDQGVQRILLEKYIPRVRKLQKQIIAHAKDTLRHVRIPDSQGESELAPLVAESFLVAMNRRGHHVDFAVHNAGGVRNSLHPGDVSVADIAGKLLPFAVPIGVYHIKGKYLAHVLEGAINNATNNGVDGTGSGSYPYTHNLRFHYSPSAPLGERIQDLRIYKQDFGWVTLDPEMVYTGSSSAYTMKGKEGYDAILNMKDEGVVTSLSMADCFTELLTEFPDKLNQINENVRCGEA